MRAPRAKPHERVKAERRVLSPDETWAAGIREAVLADCHPFQRDAILDPSRFKSLLVGRGGGKTTVIKGDALIALSSIRCGSLVYFAPTEKTAIKLLWRPLKRALAAYAAKGVLRADEFAFNESLLELSCTRTGAVLSLVGLDNIGAVNKQRGQPFDRVYIDEAGLYDPGLLADLIDEGVGPRLGERDGVIIMAGTPWRHMKGPFYDHTRPGACVIDDDGAAVPLHRPWADRDKPEFAAWDGWCSFRWTLKEVADLPDAARRYPGVLKNWQEALKKKARKRWGDDHPTWLREYMAIWSSDDTDSVFKFRAHDPVTGKPWNIWNPCGESKLEGIQLLKVAIAKLHELGHRDLSFVIAGDMGSTAPFALNVFAVAPSDPLQRIWHVYFFERPRMFARVIAELIIGPELDADDPEGILAETGWPDAWVMDADHATIDELNDKGLPFEKANRKADYKYGAIQMVNGDLQEGRILVLEHSPLAAQLQSLQWAEDKFGRVQEDPRQANHSTDTLIYGRKAIAHMFDSGGDRPDPDRSVRAPDADVRGPDCPRPGPKVEPEENRWQEDTNLLGESYDMGYATDIWGNL